MRILVIDDNAAALESARFQLADFGHEVETASGGHEAMARLETGHYDVILTDLDMPDIDGLTLCEMSLGRGHGGAWILMTGAHLDRRLATSKLPLLHKPFRSADLLSIVERARALLDAPASNETGVRASPRDSPLRNRCNQT